MSIPDKYFKFATKNQYHIMNISGFVFTLFLVCMLCPTVSAEKKAAYPKAEIKVQYRYHEEFLRGSDGVIRRDIPMLLIANNAVSKFYCPDTEYRDSLESTPSGRAKAKEILHSALRQYSSGADRSVLDNIVYKTFMYVFKDVAKAEMQVYDKAGLTEFGHYSEPCGEQQWQICDSIKEILGYECQMAQSDYHGRHWTAWFATDIPLQDGPWKFCGLPGLILEASEPSGQHHFLATGIEYSDKEIVPIYTPNNYEKMSRKDLLKGRRNSLENGMSIFRARTGYDLGADDAPVTEESRKYDFMETDYH